MKSEAVRKVENSILQLIGMHECSPQSEFHNKAITKLTDMLADLNDLYSKKIEVEQQD